MSVNPTTRASSGLGAYQQAMRTARMEQDAAHLAKTLQAQNQTTVRTSTVGFSLGPFSLDLTTRDVQLPTKDHKTTLQHATFTENLHAETTRQTTTTPQKTDTMPANQTLARLRALEAYATTSLNTATPGHIGTV